MSSRPTSSHSTTSSASSSTQNTARSQRDSPSISRQSSVAHTSTSSQHHKNSSSMQIQLNDIQTPTTQQQADTDVRQVSKELEALEEKLGKEEANELSELFKLVDKDGGGTISHDEFHELLHSMSVKPTPADLELIYEEIDKDGDGTIQYEEFLSFMSNPGIRGESGLNTLKSFKILEGVGQEPFLTGNTRKLWPHGKLHKDDLVAALLTYLPDKIKTHKEALDLIHHMNFASDGTLDYLAYVREYCADDCQPPAHMDKHFNTPELIEQKRQERRRSRERMIAEFDRKKAMNALALTTNHHETKVQPINIPPLDTNVDNRPQASTNSPSVNRKPPTIALNESQTPKTGTPHARSVRSEKSTRR